MTHAKLLELPISHDYYQGPCADLWWQPTPQSQRSLDACCHKLVSHGGHSEIYFEQQAEHLPRHSMADQVLQFWLCISQTHFAAVTALPEASNYLPVYRNDDDASSLNPPKQYLQVPGRYNFSLTFEQRPIQLKLASDSGQTIVSKHITDGYQSTDFSLLLTQFGTGCYTVSETYNDQTVSHNICYQPDMPANAIALLELTIAADFYQTAPSMALHFNARDDVLSYYVLASNYLAEDFAALTIADAGANEQQRQVIMFSRVDADDFTDAHVSADLLTTNGTKVVLFHSQLPVSRRQQGPKKLQLKLGDDVLISSLPTPGSSSITSDFFIHVAKP
ncbi:hypothetical protein GCM10011369_27090 [Neiella marina]|uniref:Uncharacterized protein n=1 Tax=Neiella marina TaxID=508461 RepID=A0A8J2XNG1_9GAMM|nr:hypothetical protein [Neiella marina]GGA83652.1 hypothetical protein GCM10011369_27090 [Neiella marina]